MRVLVLSSSSPIASAAWFEGSKLLWSADAPAQGRAEDALLELVESSDLPLRTAEAFVADVGPGSFTGVRVAVAMAKAWAWLHGVPAGGISAFDLGPVAIPARRGQWMLCDGTIVATAPEGAYGGEIDRPTFPLAQRAHPDRWTLAPPETLLPDYRLEPSISTPKTPFREAR